MGGKLKAVWPPILVAVLFLAAWQLIVVVNDIKPYLLPAPSLILTNFFTNIGLMFSTGWYTATTAFLGLVFGTIVALACALLAQRFVVVNNLITPLAAGLAAVPIIALTPILNNMFNITSRTPKVLITMVIVFFPVFVNVTRGLLQVPPVQIELMRSLNAKPRTVLRDALAVEAADMMEQYRITSILVVDSEGVLCGALNSNDLMRAKVI